MPVHSSQRKENGDGGDSLVITGEGALADEWECNAVDTLL